MQWPPLPPALYAGGAVQEGLGEEDLWSLQMARVGALGRLLCSNGVHEGHKRGPEGVQRGSRGGPEGMYRLSLDAREPQNPTKSEECQGYLQGVLYST
eukprot:1150544-Prorocentrum_minimum.AAC.1